LVVECEGADGGEGEVVTSADADGDHSGAVDGSEGFGDSAVRLGECVLIGAGDGGDIARIEDGGEIALGVGIEGGSVAGEGGAEGGGPGGGSWSSVVEADTEIIGQADEGDATSLVVVRADGLGEAVARDGGPGWWDE
jgi:hypothetical protein